jgi:hypothetical protein
MAETRREIQHPLNSWCFYWEWLRHTFTGWWGVTGDAFTALALGRPIVKAVCPGIYATAALWLAAHSVGEEWKGVLWAGAAILAVRFLWAPFWLYRDKPMAAPAATAKPEVILTAVLNDNKDGNVHFFASMFEIENFSDAVAVNVTATIDIPDTSYSIRVGRIARLSKGAPQRFFPEFFHDGKPWTVENLYEAQGRLDKFMIEAREAAITARGEQANARLADPNAPHDSKDAQTVTESVVERIVGQYKQNAEVVMFDVIYTDADRIMEYRRPHIFRYEPRRMKRMLQDRLTPITIGLADTPDPKPRRLDGNHR